VNVQLIPKRYYLSIISLLPILSAHAFIAFWTLKKCRELQIPRWIWRAGVLIDALLVTVSLLTGFRTMVRIPRPFAAAAQTFVNLCALIGAATVAVSLVVGAVKRRLPGQFRNDRRLALRTLAGMTIAAPAAIAGFGVFIERTNFEVCETPLVIRNLHPALEGLRLLQISDIHLSPYLSVTVLAKVIDCANELHADLAFITGDLITAKGDPLDACIGQLARLRANAPMLGCLGNHEIYADAVDYTVVHGARAGIHFLRNEARSIQIGGTFLNIAGVDYQAFGRRSAYLRHGAQMIQSGAVNILLSHNPDVFPVAAAQGYDLTLAGHTHGGQVTCEMLSPTLNPAKMLTPFVRGLYRVGERACYVSRGIGTLGIPARLGARPEITLVTLRRDQTPKFQFQ
jgi:predicted MPP superfamily phosphohydrolase